MRFRNEFDELLGNPIRIRVLRVLTRYPTLGFTGRELARSSKSSPSQTIAALECLLDSGVIYREVAGRSHVWRLAPEHVLHDLLVSMFQGEEDPLQLLKRDIEDMLQPLPVKRAFLFGSVARGDERPTSDVDLLVLVGSKAAKEAVEDGLSRVSHRIFQRFGNPLSPLVLDTSQSRYPPNPELVKTAQTEGVEIGRRAVTPTRVKPLPRARAKI